MNVTLVSLEALLLKATHESLPCPDALALEAFCSVLRDAAEGPQLAAQALAARVHTRNAREALLALSTVDRCMRKCGPAFHAEIGKFRFLNEMIKLVSPKYFANRTAPEVQIKVLQLLHAWSIEYPKESKFKVAYDMLKNQGVIKETPPPLPPEDVVVSPRSKHAIFEDEEKSKLLQKLLQSKKPEDLQHANRLIKSMVREEERRTEASCRRAHEVASALDSAGLLLDMLLHGCEASPDEEQLIDELYARCGRMRPVLQRLAAAEGNQENLEDILSSIDQLDTVGEMYKQFMTQKNIKNNFAKKSTTAESLLDFAGLNSPIGDKDKANEANAIKIQAVDELGDIFSARDGPANIAEPLKPVNLMTNGLSSDDVDLLGAEKANKTEGWNELDSLGEELLKQSLPDNAKRVDNFNSKSVKKIPMKELEKSSPNHNEAPKNGGNFDLDFFTKTSEEKLKKTEEKTKRPEEQLKKLEEQVKSPQAQKEPWSPTDEYLLDISETVANTVTGSKDIPKSDDFSILDPVPIPKRNKPKEQDNVTVEPLTDVTVDVKTLELSEVPPVTVYKEEGGVTVILEFCKGKPRDDVNVVIVTTRNNSQHDIEDYKFQPVVPKGCKVRLLPASGSALARYNPYEAPALRQPMLVARPRGRRADLKFVITYVANGEPCSEMGEAIGLPLDLVEQN